MDLGRNPVSEMKRLQDKQFLLVLKGGNITTNHLLEEEGQCHSLQMSTPHEEAGLFSLHWHSLMARGWHWKWMEDYRSDMHAL